VATPNLKLSAALKALQRLQGKHEGVVESADLSPVRRPARRPFKAAAAAPKAGPLRV